MFFHWCIAFFAMIWGEVTEFISRIPSALALIAVVCSTFWFYCKRSNVWVALANAMIMLTCMELHRAGGNCRVDMVLTALTIGAIYRLYRWWEKGMNGLPWLALVLMSCGVLTKGPVGAIIPCFVMGCFLLLRKTNFWRAFFTMMGFVLLSLIVPALWYAAAWQQGGQAFLDLVYEENIGRMTGSMSYESHEGPWIVNVGTLIAGMLPFTLLLIMGLFSEPKLRQRLSSAFATGENRFMLKLKALAKRFWKWLTGMDNLSLYTLTAAVAIFVFYCIPKSKRSVYIMPMYPFVGYFMANYIMHLAKEGRRVVRVYGHILAGLAMLLLAVFIVLKLGVVPETIFKGKRALDNIATLEHLSAIGGFWPLLCIVATTLCGIAWFVYAKKNKEVSVRDVAVIMGLTLGIYLSVDGAYKPAALAAKCVKPVAQELMDNVLLPEDEGVYEYIELGEIIKGNPVHYFELNFFLHNRILNFKSSKPEHGFLLIGVDDAKLRLDDFRAEGYNFELRMETPRRVAGQLLQVYYFTK